MCGGPWEESGEEGHDLCVMLNEAYSMLKDPEMRLLYDAELAQQRVRPSLFAHNVPVYPGPEVSNGFTLVVK